jgi:hypothetical protein
VDEITDTNDRIARLEAELAEEREQRRRAERVKTGLPGTGFESNDDWQKRVEREQRERRAAARAAAVAAAAEQRAAYAADAPRRRQVEAQIRELEARRVGLRAEDRRLHEEIAELQRSV